MSITLTEILDLIGKLDDTPGQDTARERFRWYLDKNLTAPGQIRDYVEECLRNTGDQYNRALHDLVNYVGKFLGFDTSSGTTMASIVRLTGFDRVYTVCINPERLK